MGHKITEEELKNTIDKTTDQNIKFDILPILKEIHHYCDLDSKLKTDLVKIQYDNVRKEHVKEVFVKCYELIQNKDIGSILEDAVHLILYRLNCIKDEPSLDLLKYIPKLNVPPHSYKFTRHPKKDDDVDFVDKSSKIAIECKNWESYTITDSYVENQIVPRFQKYPKYRKILLISDVPLLVSSKNLILQNKTEICTFSSQITYEKNKL